jgi:hypothetical protein
LERLERQDRGDFFRRGGREDSEEAVILGEGQREEENPANGKFLEIL